MGGSGRIGRMAEDDRVRKNKDLFKVTYEKPDDYVFLVDEYKKKFELPMEDERALMERLPDDETCIQVATCIRVASCDDERYRDADFLPLMKKYFETVKNHSGVDFETRVAYFLLSIVAEFESIWTRSFTVEELVVKKTEVEGEEVPQGKTEDIYGLGEIPESLVAYAKGVLLEHLKTTQSWQDIKDVNDLMSRVTEYVDEEVESDSSYLKVADCGEFVRVVEERRSDFEKMGEETKGELKRFDSLKRLVTQPRHEDGAE